MLCKADWIRYKVHDSAEDPYNTYSSSTNANTIQYNTMQYYPIPTVFLWMQIQYHTIQYCTIQCNKMQCNIPYNTITMYSSSMNENVDNIQQIYCFLPKLKTLLRY